MRGRDLFILGAVLLVGGFAVADSFRGSASGEEPPATETTPRQMTNALDGSARQTRQEAPPGWPRGLFEGEIVFTDRRDCRIRVIALPGGRERLSRGPLATSCDLWAAPVTSRVAIGLGPPFHDAVPFRFLDLAQRDRDLGGYHALFGLIAWSPDGQRAAWCGRSRTGFDLEIGGPARRLPECPAAYTPEGEIAFARGNALVSEGRVLVRASGGITHVHYGSDGSLVVVVEGRRLERFSGHRRQHALDLTGAFEGQTPVLSPDNCGALFPRGGSVRLLDLGCLGPHLGEFPGKEAAWSPDGEWIATAGAEAIDFWRADGSGTRVTWPAQASQLYWR